MLVCFADLIYRSKHTLLSLFNPNGTVADSLDQINRVAHEKNGDVVGRNEILDALLAFLLEQEVTYRKRLVNDQHIRLSNGCNGKGNSTIPEE